MASKNTTAMMYRPAVNQPLLKPIPKRVQASSSSNLSMSITLLLSTRGAGEPTRISSRCLVLLCLSRCGTTLPVCVHCRSAGHCRTEFRISKVVEVHAEPQNPFHLIVPFFPFFFGHLFDDSFSCTLQKLCSFQPCLPACRQIEHSSSAPSSVSSQRLQSLRVAGPLPPATFQYRLPWPLTAFRLRALPSRFELHPQSLSYPFTSVTNSYMKSFSTLTTHFPSFPLLPGILTPRNCRWECWNWHHRTGRHFTYSCCNTKYPN
jgi:hypothetical protein